MSPSSHDPPRRGTLLPAQHGSAARAACCDLTPWRTRTAAPVCYSVWFRVLAKKLLKETPRPLNTFLGEDHRFRFAARIRDVSLFVQTIHGFPVEALPRPRAVMQAKVEQSKHCIVDLVGVEFHRSARCKLPLHGLTTTSPLGPRNSTSNEFRTSRPRMRSC